MPEVSRPQNFQIYNDILKLRTSRATYDFNLSELIVFSQALI